MNRFLLILAIFFLVLSPLAGQNQTARDFFNSLSNTYASIHDYTANLIVQQNGQQLEGQLSVLAPDQLFIEFTSPQNQVLMVSDGWLNLYIPGLNVYNRQQLPQTDSSAVGLVGSSLGLQLFAESYNISYYETNAYVPLFEGANEKVIKLKLEWASQAEAFREIIISVTEGGLIRQIHGTTSDYREMTLKFLNIAINQNQVPDTLFDYIEPRDAYTKKNFLFDSERYQNQEEEGTEE